MPHTILRISGIYAVELMELPDVIPFRADQRVNFIDRRDVVRALASALESTQTTNQVINIAGDDSWWLTGSEFITKIYNALGVHVEANYATRYTSFDWYDTTASQSILNYQNIPFSQFVKEMEDLGKNLF
jgi:nucleoside-diphosphate-sugar epimerase